MTMTNPAPATAGVVTTVFDTPGNYTWAVPAGTYSVTLNVNGAQGGGDGGSSAFADGTGGKGARVLASFAVHPGDLLSLRVAGRGTVNAGGYGGGGQPGQVSGLSQRGFGGGGASQVLLNGVLVALAGGGGGATASGTDGGNSQSAGEGGTDENGGGGGAALATAAGNGGTRGTGGATTLSRCYGSGSPGGTGGAGGTAATGVGGRGGASFGSDTWYGAAGGGGGGGLYGGGGGGSSADCHVTADHGLHTERGGGGGGGSSYLSPSRLSGQVFDGARSGDGAIGIVLEDTTPPVAAPVVSPAPNAAGWSNTNVTVFWNWSDPESDVDLSRCTTVSQVSQTGIAVLQAWCANGAGISGAVSQQVKVDLVDPTVSPTFGPEGVTWHWYDAVSGIDPGACPATTPWSETVTATCSDRAGNHTTIEIPRHP